VLTLSSQTHHSSQTHGLSCVLSETLHLPHHLFATSSALPPILLSRKDHKAKFNASCPPHSHTSLPRNARPSFTLKLYVTAQSAIKHRKQKGLCGGSIRPMLTCASTFLCNCCDSCYTCAGNSENLGKFELSYHQRYMKPHSTCPFTTFGLLPHPETITDVFPAVLPISVTAGRDLQSRLPTQFWKFPCIGHDSLFNTATLNQPQFGREAQTSGLGISKPAGERNHSHSKNTPRLFPNNPPHYSAAASPHPL
jgi:hypothetical protein